MIWYIRVCGSNMHDNLQASDTSTRIGSLYEFDCKQVLKALQPNGWVTIAFEHKVCYIWQHHSILLLLTYALTYCICTSNLLQIFYHTPFDYLQNDSRSHFTSVFDLVISNIYHTTWGLSLNNLFVYQKVHTLVEMFFAVCHIRYSLIFLRIALYVILIW